MALDNLVLGLIVSVCVLFGLMILFFSNRYQGIIEMFFGAPKMSYQRVTAGSPTSPSYFYGNHIGGQVEQVTDLGGSRFRIKVTGVADEEVIEKADLFIPYPDKALANSELAVWMNRKMFSDVLIEEYRRENALMRDKVGQLELQLSEVSKENMKLRVGYKIKLKEDAATIKEATKASGSGGAIMPWGFGSRGYGGSMMPPSIGSDDD